jgi:tripartite-type tricarboxylate transporter receptor subunit TctC
MLIGFQAGGSLDSIARLLAEQMKDYAPSLIAENKPGAAGRIALEQVKTSPPDGATLILTPASTLVLYPHIYRKLAYDALADFTPVTSVGAVGYDIAVGPKVPADVKTLRDFVGWCKANPKDAVFGSPGAGTGHHFVGVMFARAAGIDMVHVPYRGAAPAVMDLIAGHVHVVFDNLPGSIEHIRAGKLRALAVTGARRSESTPEYPTMEEAGVPGFVVESWYGLMAPAGTPTEIVSRVRTEMLRVLGRQDVKAFFARQGADIVTSTPEEFAKTIHTERARWAKLIKATGSQID